MADALFVLKLQSDSYLIHVIHASTIDRRVNLALTEVVFTPHSSNFSNVGVGAFGVSMNSNSLSEPLVLCGLEAMIADSSIGV